MVVAPPHRRSKREAASEARRQAILDAALEIFVSQGFAAARLDDIVSAAGVAKGTIYLFFRDKQDLFEQVVRGAVGPVFADMAVLAEKADAPFDAMLAALFDTFQREILATPKREIPRLIFAEGRRFPELAAFYHREVITPGLDLLRRLAQRAHERGELVSDALVRHPVLAFAPMLVSLIWTSTFDPFQKLDVADLLATHRELLSPPQARKPTP
ncbi:AcrR family transcriptional regulator [Rhodoblastus acidophilus]|uniref:TetR/AcrR family transcriptional regulator n=1 Tax=Rhodoblastus acidophilus TaxID=1074 RepID=UPI00222440BF|nr:TetR/AcrR family transcriptional regulator [Rhodoblastus acidophilus]MCW2285666.1 AcrR family transcriptional regulator [Rhodoblastus acidophilus]MCW2334576.1 AcrR family transcriptional regulator [Rhodoblastus acidophilus]